MIGETKLNMNTAPWQLNLELTTRCPLRCPQCYCDLERAKDLDPDRAIVVLRQAAKLGVSNINLSGGETMLYPHLHRLIEECRDLGLCSSIALSGYGLDESSLQKLIDSGVDYIFISLNGSTEEVSNKTRDGFEFAINALELLKRFEFPKTSVNWVAHSENIADFRNVVLLCSELKVMQLMVMLFKPDSSFRMDSAPGEEDFCSLAEDIKQLRVELPNLIIDVESCYSPLLAYLGQKFFGNMNRGVAKGCVAGRDAASLNVDGLFIPCRHLDFDEDYDDLRDYWQNSEVLQTLRTVEENPGPPCNNCEFSNFCLPCLAVNAKMHGKIEKSNKDCFLHLR